MKKYIICHFECQPSQNKSHYSHNICFPSSALRHQYEEQILNIHVIVTVLSLINAPGAETKLGARLLQCSIQMGFSMGQLSPPQS